MKGEIFSCFTGKKLLPLPLAILIQFILYLVQVIVLNFVPLLVSLVEAVVILFVWVKNLSRFLQLRCSLVEAVVILFVEFKEFVKVFAVLAL